MRISCVSVTNLFGMFNHRIPFNLNEHITIIHGPNGFGKTVLLRMINALLQQRYSEIRDIPFDQFIIEFDDKTSIRIVKTKMSEKKTLSHVMSEKRKFVADYKFATDYNLSIEFFKNDSKAESYVPKPVIQPGFPLEMIERIIPELGRCGSHSWLYLPTNEELSLDEVMTRFGSLLERYCKVSKCEPPEWLRKIYNSINIRFIETQRILDFQKNRERHRFIGNFEPVPVVNIYSEELAKAIQAKLAEYATLSQSLDRTFPNRLVRGNGKTLSTDSLKKKLSELENERSRLMATGFLDKEGEIDDFKEFQTINKSNENVLSVYVEDVKNKFRVFDDITKKIDILLQIVNTRFQYKSMSIDKKEGFKFFTKEGEALSLKNLSSGEQHELVLFYELLFRVKQNSLILIDEPELSLHVVWQQQFLKDVQEIAKISNFDVLIATHSPQIIHDRWNLTVQLKGPKDERISRRK